MLLQYISSPSSCCSDVCEPDELDGSVAVCQCMADTGLQVNKLGEGSMNPARWWRELKLSCVATLEELALKRAAPGPCQAIAHLSMLSSKTNTSLHFDTQDWITTSHLPFHWKETFCFNQLKDLVQAAKNAPFMRVVGRPMAVFSATILTFGGTFTTGGWRTTFNH